MTSVRVTNVTKDHALGRTIVRARCAASTSASSRWDRGVSDPGRER